MFFLSIWLHNFVGQLLSFQEIIEFFGKLLEVIEDFWALITITEGLSLKILFRKVLGTLLHYIIHGCPLIK